MPDSLYQLDRDGQRYGPYTLRELRDYHAQGFVHGSDLVWTEGLSDWVTASSVLASQAAPPPGSPAPTGSPAPPVSPAPRVSPAPPVLAKPSVDPPLFGPIGASVTTPEPDTRGFLARTLSMEGRLNRAKYIGTLFAIFGVMCLVMFVVILGGAALGTSIGPSPNGEPGPFEFIIGLGFHVLAAFQIVKRLHDLDRAGTHYWLLLIPFYNFYLALLLLFKKGTEGPNQFGPDPLAGRAT